MALNNIVVEIPTASTLEERLAICVNAFASASGLTADENNVFWVNEDKTLGVKILINGNNIVTRGINSIGSELTLQVTSGVSASSTAYLTYNQSANSGSVFAFGLSNSKMLQSAICKDDTGAALLVGFATTTSINIFSSTSALTVILPNPRCGAATISLIKLPTILKPVAFADIYAILGSPSVAYDVDSSVYVGGSLYKIITPSTAQNSAALAFKV